MAVAAIAGGGAMGITQLSGSSAAVAAVPAAASPAGSPIVVVPSLPIPEVTATPTPTDAVPTGWEIPDTGDATSAPVESSTPKPTQKPTPKHTPSPTPKPTTTRTPSPKPTTTPTPRAPTCTDDAGQTYKIGDTVWGPYDSNGHRIQHVCSATTPGAADWTSVPPQAPQGSCTTEDSPEKLADGYTYYCVGGTWSSTPPPSTPGPGDGPRP
ncbi:MAG TPA: hypothetical protein VGJ14_06580 [Sporichthyaceae bacterium]